MVFYMSIVIVNTTRIDYASTKFKFMFANMQRLQEDPKTIVNCLGVT
jgi:hypothetical protein